MAPASSLNFHYGAIQKRPQSVEQFLGQPSNSKLRGWQRTSSKTCRESPGGPASLCTHLLCAGNRSHPTCLLKSPPTPLPAGPKQQLLFVQVSSYISSWGINSPDGIKALQPSLKYSEQYGRERGEPEDTSACCFLLQTPDQRCKWTDPKEWYLCQISERSHWVVQGVSCAASWEYKVFQGLV